MVNADFDMIGLIRKCKKTLSSQTALKNVTMKGPVLTYAHEKLYFRHIFSDEQRFGQLILNFLSNGIKFTQRGGQVSIHLTILNVEDTMDLNQSASEHSVASAPDSEADEERSEPGVLTEKLLTFEMVFRDSGCGIPIEK